MEKTVSDLADLVKKMREDRASERDADREAVNSLKKALEENTAVMKDVINWRSQVDYKVDNLQLSVKNLSQGRSSRSSPRGSGESCLQSVPI
ncbi:unnamed protein product [Urochloa humidicola]